MKNQLFTWLFFTRAIVDIVAIIVLVRYVYYPIHKKKDYYFAFFLLNLSVFVLTFLLNKTSFGAASAVGLLAAFSILRLRTETITVKDMTYLFLVLTVAVINATTLGPYYEMIAVNVLIVGLAYGLDKEWLSKSIHMRSMELDTLDNIMPEKMDLLLSDLRTRTGLDIQRIKIESVDLPRKRAVIRIYYY